MVSLKNLRNQSWAKNKSDQGEKIWRSRGKKISRSQGKNLGSRSRVENRAELREKMKSRKSDLGLKYLGSQSHKKFEMSEMQKKLIGSWSWGKKCRVSSHLKKSSCEL